MWKIYISIENGEKRSFSLHPTTTIGTLIVQLVSKLTSDENWSEYSLWYPEKDKWLTNTRDSLDQCGLSNGVSLNFMRTCIPIYVILPNLRVIQHSIDTCGNVMDVLKELCESIKITHFEEMSFLIIQSSDLENGKSKKITKRPPSMYESISLLYEEQQKESLPFSDFNPELPRVIKEIFPPTNSLLDWCSFHENWVLINQSLKSQGFGEKDVLYLRPKYSKFVDVNPNVDYQSFEYIFNHAAYSFLIQETKCQESELFDLASLLWHVLMVQANWIKLAEPNDQLAAPIDDIEQALSTLEGAMIKVYKGESEKLESLVRYGTLMGTIVSQKTSFEQKYYEIKITNFNDRKSKKKKISLRFTLEDLFVECLAACKSISRGLTLNHPYIENEQNFINAYLGMKRRIEKTSPELSQYCRYSAEDIFPKWIFKRPNQSAHTVLDKLFEMYLLYGYSSLIDVKKVYIQRWASIKFANIISFKVIFNPPEDKVYSKKNIEILGLHQNYLARINPITDEVIEQWPYFSLKSWHVNWQTKIHHFKFTTKSISFAAISCDIRKIYECVGANVFMGSRTQSSAVFDSATFYRLTL
ncbi:hypothetical protein MXB_1396 [Myxobolus squamalis]|nr:hypothetical protein MXB_1396 [Myxobolus squamalis]